MKKLFENGRKLRNEAKDPDSDDADKKKDEDIVGFQTHKAEK